MTKAQMPVARLKAQLSEALRAVETGQTVIVTRHGKAVAALVSAEDLSLLERVRATDRAEGLAAIAGGWKGARRLVDAMSQD